MTDTPESPDLEVDLSIPQGLSVTQEDLPYRILLVGDFAGAGAARLSGALSDGVVEVTADSLDELMQQTSPTLTFTSTDPTRLGNVMVEVTLTVGSLKSFQPLNLIAPIPLAQNLQTVRALIVDRLAGKLTYDAFSESVVEPMAAEVDPAWLKACLSWTPQASTADTSAVDDLLGQLSLNDGPDEPPPPRKSNVGKLLSEVADSGSSIPAGEASGLRKTLAEIDRRLALWTTQILHAPEVQTLESAWRALAHLVSHIEFRKGLRLAILHAPRDEVVERLESRIIDAVFEEDAQAPDVIVVNQAFGNTAADWATLDGLAQLAAFLPAVVLAGAAPSFLGVKLAFQVATLPPISNMLDQHQFARWRSLRGQPYARSLGVVFGRCMLRDAYTRSTDSARFSYEEPCLTDKDLCWSEGPIAAACTIARSVAEHRWPTYVSGPLGGVLDSFKSCAGGKRGDKTFGPADTALPQPKIEELGYAGINAVTSGAHRDAMNVTFWNGMTAAAAPRNDMNAILEVSLPYQLFACRLSSLLLAIKPHLSGQSPETIEATVATHIRSWLEGGEEMTSEHLKVATRSSEDKPGVTELAVTVTPPNDLLPGGVPIVLGFPVEA